MEDGWLAAPERGASVEITPQVEGKKYKVMKVMKVMLRKATKVHVYV